MQYLKQGYCAQFLPPVALQTPQSVEPSGGHVGMGMRFDCMELEAIERAEAEADVWVEANAPVTARTTTNARTRCFMGVAPFGD
jgi:hypothetical protein